MYGVLQRLGQNQILDFETTSHARKIGTHLPGTLHSDAVSRLKPCWLILLYKMASSKKVKTRSNLQETSYLVNWLNKIGHLVNKTTALWCASIPQLL